MCAGQPTFPSALRSWRAAAIGLGFSFFAAQLPAQPNTLPPAYNSGGGITTSNKTAEEAFERGLEWMFFPSSPPPLGAEVAVVASTRQTGTPEVLRLFLTEPFYAPLAARIVHVAGEERLPQTFSEEEYVRIDSLLGLRSALVRELYDRTDAVMQLEPEQRIAPFAALAAMQRQRLDEMERTAEWVRASLARTNPWTEHRRWRLNRGSLREDRDKTYALEYMVIRAAAYYQPGFSPAQRRLVRELAIEMNENLATHGAAPGGGSFLFFFSPETARIERPESAPLELDALIDRYEGEKRRLKDELREVIYETDGWLLESARTRRIEELAAAQAGAIDALEELAEQVRRGLVQLPDYRRYRRARLLDAKIEERLQEFTEERHEIEKERVAYIRRRMRERTSPASGQRSASGRPSEQAARESVAAARSSFEFENASRLMAHERKAEQLLVDLVAALPSEEAGRLNGPPDIAIREFIERREEMDAYAEYDLATLEPGLSPPQRRLLFASAMARLRQVLLPPEPQPTAAPATLLGVGGVNSR